MSNVKLLQLVTPCIYHGNQQMREREREKEKLKQKMGKKEKERTT